GQFDTMPASAQFLGLFAACTFDEDSPHRLGSGGKEMSSAIPVLSLFAAYQPQVHLVHQRRRLKRLARGLLPQLFGSQSTQRVVHQRQQLLGCARVTLLDGRQDLRHFVHVVCPTSVWSRTRLFVRTELHPSLP